MPPLDDLLDTVDTWFAEEIQRPPLSYHTECYNQMYAARASLRNRLSVVVTGEPLPSLAPPSGDEEAGAGAEGTSQADEPEKDAGETDPSPGAGKSSTKPQPIK